MNDTTTRYSEEFYTKIINNESVTVWTGPNQTDANQNGYEMFSPIFTSSLVGSVYIAIGCLGIIGNFLVVVVFLNSPHLRRRLINMYIINQSLLDMVCSIFLIGISRLTSEVPYSGLAGLLYCKLWQSRFHLWGFLASSTYNLIALTMERYTEVVHPIWHKVSFTKGKALLSMVIIWIFGPVWEGLGKILSTHIVDGQCSLYSKWPSKAARKVYGINVVVIKLIVPLMVLVYAYGRIAWILHIRMGPRNANNKESGMARGKRNTIKTLFIVTVVFFLCWSWNQVYFLMFNVGYPADFTSDFYHFSVILCYFNSCINPFIYAMQYEQFQTAAKKMLCKSIGKNRVGDSEITVSHLSKTVSTVEE